VAAPAARGRDKTILIGGAVIVLMALIIVIASFAPRPEAIQTVAVLPVQPLSPNEELSAIGLGLSDAVVQRLAYAPGITVRPIASVRKYLGGMADPLSVGREMKVDAVITGTIQRDHDRYRVTMELVDVRTDRSRWTGRIEEKAADVFRLQDIVSEATLRSLPNDALSNRPSRVVKPPLPAAHEAFLKGRYYWSRRTGDDVERAVEEFERAVSLDDSYAAAWAGLASAINLQSLHFVAVPAASFPRARSAARQALLLDPNHPEAHAAIGFIHFYHDWKWSEAEKSFRRSIELDPTNGNYRQLLSNLLMATGRFDEGLRHIDEAVRVDPASIMVRSVAGRQYYLAGRYEESARFLREAIAMDNTFAAPHYSLGLTLSAMGNVEDGKRELEESIRRNFGAQAYMHLAVFAAANGDREQARLHVEQARASTKNGAVLPYDMAAVHGALGDFDAAFRSLDRAIADRYSGMVWLKIDPRVASLRADPRYPLYLKRVGL
jgi:tetratricopeptide (TPR) repeat protein